jgi:hypothetical protein
LVYDHLRVVSLRVDPEQRQIRFVWQPVLWDSVLKKVSTEDRAAHTFYQLSLVEWRSFFADWTALQKGGKRVSPKVPLSVHPVLQDPAQSSAYRAELFKILRRYCRESNLIQVTAMQLMSADSTWWSFAGIERKKNPQLESGSRAAATEWKKVSIPGIKGSKVDFFNLTSSHQELNGQFNFYGDDQVELAEVVRGYVDRRPETKKMYVDAFSSTLKIQNPHLTDALKIDCASCHIAQPVRYGMLQKLPESQRQEKSEWKFVNPDPRFFDLRNVTRAARSTKVVRALGYFEDQPALNQRVIHESALSAHFLNQIKK